jgi:YggT family protein
MQVIVLILEWALRIYFWMFIARFILEWVRAFNPRFKPRGILLYAAEIAMTATDPLLKLLRKFIKPIRLGNVALDFSWTVAILLISLLQSVIARLG